MRGFFAALLAAAALFSLTSAAAEAPPRYVSLKTGGAEGRAGPGPEHRVTWLYERVGLPLQVLAERGAWVRVRDPEGDESWMQTESLDPRRTIYVREQTTLRRTAQRGGRPIAYLMPGVIGAITACEGEWRRVAVGGRIGWVENSAVWGGDCSGLEIRD
jgi:SH3-like domain-containing protein